MSDPRYDYFNVSVDKEANRELVAAISAEVVAALRPKEAIATPYVIGGLLDRAARGELVRAGSDADFGLGGGELMAQVVVPLVTELTTTVFKTTGVAGVDGLEELPDQLPIATREEVERMARESGIRMSRKEAAQVAVQINQLLRFQLGRRIDAPQPRSPAAPARCAPYHCAGLRRLFTDHFSSEELRILCFDLEVPHEEVIYAEKSASVRRLLEYFLRRNQLEQLVALARTERPEVDWSRVLSV